MICIIKNFQTIKSVVLINQSMNNSRYGRPWRYGGWGGWRGGYGGWGGRGYGGGGRGWGGGGRGWGGGWGYWG